MPQTEYNLHLKGYVGGYDFDRNYVDYVLAQRKDKPVHVLIDSLGVEEPRKRENAGADDFFAKYANIFVLIC